MNLIIFGGSGRTGSQLVAQALRDAHRVTVFVRRRHKIEHLETEKNLSILVGDIGNLEQVSSAMRGHDVVISALGVSKTLHHDEAVIAGIKNILLAMQTAGIKRIVYLSVFLAFGNKQQFSFFAMNILRRIIRNEVHDHEVKENLIRHQAKEYIIVRAVRLTEQKLRGKCVHGQNLVIKKLLPSIGRADTAHFMLRQLGDTPYLNKAVIITGSL